MKQLSEESAIIQEVSELGKGRVRQRKRKPLFLNLDEGELTEIKKQLVQKNTLADAIDNLGIAYYLIMGKGDVEKTFRIHYRLKRICLKRSWCDSLGFKLGY